MSKDSYWFRHDSTAGRGLRMRKMAHIYGHWGKGVYWDVIEILRDQSNYCFDYDESSLQMLCDLIGCKDEPKFLSWMRDCINIELFDIDGSKFFSPILCENMAYWESRKENGSKRKAKPKHNLSITGEDIIEQNITEQNKTDKIKVFTPPSVDLVISYFTDNGYSSDAGRKAFNYYSVADWKDSKGKSVKNWKQKMQGVWFKDENKAKKEITYPKVGANGEYIK